MDHQIFGSSDQCAAVVKQIPVVVVPDPTMLVFIVFDIIIVFAIIVIRIPIAIV